MTRNKKRKERPFSDTENAILKVISQKPKATEDSIILASLGKKEFREFDHPGNNPRFRGK